VPLTRLPQALTLDVGHTLLFPKATFGEMYAAKLGAYGVEVSAEWVDRTLPHAWEAAKSAQAGLIYGTTREQGLAFWIDVNRRLLPPRLLSREALETFVADLFESYGRGEAWRVDPALPSLLSTCHALNIPVALLSNWDQRLRGLLEELDLVECFHTVVISAEVGMEKPSPGIFEHALRELACPAEGVVHVGDTWEDDILGARTAGMKAIWIASEETAMPAPVDGVSKLHGVGPLAEHLSQACNAAS
jgi:putative hydrolase of the HAD superfamily